MTSVRTATLLLALSLPRWLHAIDLAPVAVKQISRKVELPGELQPFLSVDLHAKVSAYVEKMLVDRGSVVKRGQLLAQLSAPEVKSQLAEAEWRFHAAQSEQAQAEAQLAAARSTADRLAKAAQTPGAIAGNEVLLAQQQAEAGAAAVTARHRASEAARSALEAQQELAAYLKITAPFDGVVTERAVHPGALVGPGNDSALLTLQQISHLRLIVPVPEESLGTTKVGAKVDFRVPAFPDRLYSGAIARVSHTLDSKTRTMPIELDVWNRDGTLAPGMYPSIAWPVQRKASALVVPRTSVVTTTERTFVIRSHQGRAEWVNVKKGAADGDRIEVVGDLQVGDLLVRRATDEIRDGSALDSR